MRVLEPRKSEGEKGAKKAMIAIRGVYDGKTFRALPGEVLPIVEREVPVNIVFLDENQLPHPHRSQLGEVIREMREARSRMVPLDCDLRDLIEDGRER